MSGMWQKCGNDHFLIFRLSQKLNAKIKAGTLPAGALDENPCADWSCHLFVADQLRPQNKR